MTFSGVFERDIVRLPRREERQWEAELQASIKRLTGFTIEDLQSRFMRCVMEEAAESRTQL